jgi:hypothetical protein
MRKGRLVIVLFACLGITLATVLADGSLATFSDQDLASDNAFVSSSAFPTKTPTPTPTHTPTDTPTSTPTPVPCSTSGTFGAVADTYVKEDKGGDDNFGTTVDLKVKAESGKVKRTLVAFDVSSIPAGSTVTSATLTLCLSAVPGAGSQGRTEELRLVTSSWTEMGVIWNTQPTVSSTVTDTITVPAAALDVSFTVTADIQSWVDGTANNGWRLGDAAEGASSGDVKYHSRESTDSDARPRLAVTYTPP